MTRRLHRVSSSTDRSLAPERCSPEPFAGMIEAAQIPTEIVLHVERLGDRRFAGQAGSAAAAASCGSKRSAYARSRCWQRTKLRSKG